METSSVVVQIAYGNAAIAVMVIALARHLGGVEAIPNDWEPEFRRTSAINACFKSTDQADVFSTNINEFFSKHTRVLRGAPTD
jgi:hypothetical protein